MISTSYKTFSKEQTEIIKKVLYFDVFKHPLTVSELYENSAIHISKESFEKELNELVEKKFLRRDADFVMSVLADEKDILRRLNGAKNANEIMPLAYRYSKIIASFPFVKGICLSGALSKNYYDENGDFDFFIITQPNRLWLCRTFLILRYKTLPKSKKKFWCVNYFISSENMRVPDVNAFTATEMAHLMPTVNYNLYCDLLNQNSWYKDFFPNKNVALSEKCSSTPDSFFKSFVEKVFKGRLGNYFDDFLLNITLNHWQKKYPELSEADFELQFRSQKNVCKRHTRGFQNKVLGLWLEKQKQFEKDFNIKFH